MDGEKGEYNKSSSVLKKNRKRPMSPGLRPRSSIKKKKKDGQKVRTKPITKERSVKGRDSPQKGGGRNRPPIPKNVTDRKKRTQSPKTIEKNVAPEL